MKPMLISIATLCAIAALAGCQNPSGSNSNYETITADPNRRTDEAKRLHTEALESIRADKPEDAQRLLKRALDADVMFGPAHNNLGKLYFSQGRHYLAAWEFQYAARLMPDRPEPRNNLGLVFEAVGKLDQAVEQYTQARVAAPDNAQIVGNLARARMRRGDRDPELKGLLEEVVLKDERPDWREWARERLALWK